MLKKIAPPKEPVKVLRSSYLEGMRKLPELRCLQDLLLDFGEGAAGWPALTCQIKRWRQLVENKWLGLTRNKKCAKYANPIKDDSSLRKPRPLPTDMPWLCPRAATRGTASALLPLSLRCFKILFWEFVRVTVELLAPRSHCPRALPKPGRGWILCTLALLIALWDHSVFIIKY